MSRHGSIFGLDPPRRQSCFSLRTMDLKAHRQPWCIARREQKSREFRVTRIYRRIVVKGFFRDLVSLRTAQAIRSKKIDIRSNSSGYPFKKKMAPVRTTQAIRWKQLSSVRRAWAICSKNCHPFERLGLSARGKLSSVRTARDIRSKQLSAALLIQTTFTT